MDVLFRHRVLKILYMISKRPQRRCNSWDRQMTFIALHTKYTIERETDDKTRFVNSNWQARTNKKSHEILFICVEHGHYK